MKIDDLTSEQKAAIVLVTLGVDSASEIYKHLDDDDVERVTVEIARIGHLDQELIQAVMDEYYKMCITQKMVTEGGLEYARNVLEKAFGDSTAESLLQKMSQTLKKKAFSFVKKTDTKNLVTILQSERSQTIALVLSYLDSDQSAEVLGSLPEKKRLGVVEAIARMDSASPEAIKIVEAQIRKRFENVLTADYTNVGGVDYIASVMNYVDRANEKQIFDELGKKDPELTENIRKKMFVFEDIAGLGDRAIQTFLRDCDNKDIVYALKGATPQMCDLIYANMSSRMAETIRSDLEVTTNVRLRDVEDAQQRIVNIIRRLEEQGEIVITKGGKDEIIA